MKLKLALLAAILPSIAFSAGRFDLVSVPNQDVSESMVIGAPELGVPENLQGLWWMNGNPLADEVMSFANVHWQEVIKDGELQGYHGELPVYDSSIWAWHDSVPGRLLYSFVLKSRLVYVIEFDKDFTHGQIKPKFNPISFLPGLEFPASMLVDFTMNKVSDGEYSRDSVLFGQHGSYRFRRIVDAQGQKLPSFQEYLDKAEVQNALVPVCSIQSDNLPSLCAGK